MTAIRGARSVEGRYVQIKNSALQDERLSFRARGILAYVLSLPSDVRVNSLDLAKAAPEGRDAVRAALKELESYGYRVVTKVSGGKGRIGTQSVITDDPGLLHEPGNPAAENPPSGPFRGTASQAPVASAVKDKDVGKDEEMCVGVADAAPTVGDRAKKIADEFKLRYKLGTPYMGVLKIVKSAITEGRHSDDEIIRALVRLGETGRPVSGNTLLIELGGGLQPTPRAAWQEPSAYDKSPANRGLDEVLW